eukprot:gnl/MRDRNA2_/MRDRNA2_86129_c0_seq1.p1 gnl/MRDRNA2_/MRDRNA2_86129_c0~~gnl/MRDRNA2_/MRDRNA2_86129_c0_seq1.p1  ORF type:complete len:332 (+),score=71.59 gnl/MRDRNA2_/MRDRNA2_86129_c0_seq1:81-998(+)
MSAKVLCMMVILSVPGIAATRAKTNTPITMQIRERGGTEEFLEDEEEIIHDDIQDLAQPRPTSDCGCKLDSTIEYATPFKYSKCCAPSKDGSKGCSFPFVDCMNTYLKQKETDVKKEWAKFLVASAKQNNTILFLFGGSGAGKSYALEKGRVAAKLQITTSEFLMVDTDDVVMNLPEWKASPNGCGEAATRCYGVAIPLAAQFQKMAADAGYNQIIAPPARQADKIVKAINGEGDFGTYKTMYIVYVNATVDDGVSRALNRVKRLAPAGVIRASYKDVDAKWEQIQKAAKDNPKRKTIKTILVSN